MKTLLAADEDRAALIARINSFRVANSGTICITSQTGLNQLGTDRIVLICRAMNDYQCLLTRSELFAMDFRATEKEVIATYRDKVYDDCFSVICQKGSQTLFSDFLIRTKIPDARIEGYIDEAIGFIRCSSKFSFNSDTFTAVQAIQDKELILKVDFAVDCEKATSEIISGLPQKIGSIMEAKDDLDVGMRFAEQLQKVSAMHPIPVASQQAFLEKNGVRLPKDMRIIKVDTQNNGQAIFIEMAVDGNNYTLSVYKAADAISLPPNFVKDRKTISGWSQLLAFDPGTKGGYLYSQHIRTKRLFVVVLRLSIQELTFDRPDISALSAALSQIQITK